MPKVTCFSDGPPNSDELVVVQADDLTHCPARARSNFPLPTEWRKRGVSAFMKLDIPPGEFSGYIFDLDGTLIDTMPLHYRAWDSAMRAAGLKVKLDEDLFYSLGGVPTLRVAELIGQHYGMKVDANQVFHEKETLFLELQADA